MKMEQSITVIQFLKRFEDVRLVVMEIYKLLVDRRWKMVNNCFLFGMSLNADIRDAVAPGYIHIYRNRWHLRSFIVPKCEDDTLISDRLVP